MAEQILKDATQLGSTLTTFASRQLQTVLSELRGPAGDSGGAPDGRDGATLGALAGNVMQIVNQVGSLIVHLSQYDLVRNDANKLLLSSANPISSITVQANTATRYVLLVENNGSKKTKVTLEAALLPERGAGRKLANQALLLDVGERKRVEIALPKLPAGKQTLTLIAKGAGRSKEAGNTLTRKTVAVNILPAPQQHAP